MAGGQRRIGSMFAFVAVDPEDNTEGVVSFLSPDQTWMPLVGTDMAMVDRLWPIAEQIAARTGAQVRLLHFVERREVDVIEPGTTRLDRRTK